MDTFTGNEWLDWLLIGQFEGVAEPKLIVPVTFESLYVAPEAETLFDIDPSWVDLDLLGRSQPAPGDPWERRRLMSMIGHADPDGGSRQPTEADYARFDDWACVAFGEDLFRMYRQGGWERAPEWI